MTKDPKDSALGVNCSRCYVFIESSVRISGGSQPLGASMTPTASALAAGSPDSPVEIKNCPACGNKGTYKWSDLHPPKMQGPPRNFTRR